MKRYEGLLRPQAQPAPWPARWCVVDTVGRPIPVVDRAGIRRTGLESWHLLVMTMRGSEVVCQEESSGESADVLWQSLAEVATRQGLTWAVSPRALYSWTLLGFWERLLLGHIGLVSDRPIKRRPKPDRGLGRPPGLLMASDPPSAAGLWVGSELSRLTWVCASNYGWKGAFLEHAGIQACRLLAQTLAECSALLARYQLGAWGVTLGSMALRAWRSQHMKGCLYVSNDERARLLAGQAIAGGIVQSAAGVIRTSAGYWLDGKGLYAAIGGAADLPGGLRYASGPDCEAADSGREALRGQLRRVRLRAGGGRFPCRQGGKTEWPDGPCETVLAGPELIAAQERGLIESYGEYCAFNLSAILGGFCNACMAMRDDADGRNLPRCSTLAKALAVALIGKLHAYDECWEECTPDYNDPISGSWLGPDGRGGLTEWTALGGQVSRRLRTGLAWHAVPEIPLWIWSLGRCWLWERIDCAGREEVLYADTDGLICTERGYDRLGAAGFIRSNEWGQLRLVRGPVDVEILGPKQLRIGDELIQAGAPRDQRGHDFAAEGYWFRRPVSAQGGAQDSPYFEEEYRERRVAT